MIQEKMTMQAVAAMRADIAAIAPERVKRLPVDPERGYPVPWFVAWVDGQPEFRVADADKFRQAVRERRCWVCGEPMGRFVAFVIGPMCSVNRISGDPPSHRECAEFSVRACPFLTKPRMERREGGLPDGVVDAAGHSLPHNPGVSLVWITRDFRLVDDGKGGKLFGLGEPTAVSWWREGRAASRDECLAAIAFGLPKLAAMADGPGELALLERQRVKAEAYLPA